MYPVDNHYIDYHKSVFLNLLISSVNNYIDYHKSVFLNLLLVLLATELGMIGFHI